MPWFWGVLLEFNNGWLFISEQKMQQSFERYESECCRFHFFDSFKTTILV